MFRLRMIGKIVREAGLVHVTAVFLGFFFLCGLVLFLTERNMIGYGDALWASFEVVTTIGFGDVPVETPMGRLAMVLLSIVSIFYLAVITGVVVEYCSQLLQANAEKSVALLSVQLEHLEELSPEELAEVSRQARELAKERR